MRYAGLVRRGVPAREPGVRASHCLLRVDLSLAMRGQSLSSAICLQMAIDFFVSFEGTDRVFFGNSAETGFFAK